MRSTLNIVHCNGRGAAVHDACKDEAAVSAIDCLIGVSDETLG